MATDYKGMVETFADVEVVRVERNFGGRFVVWVRLAERPVCGKCGGRVHSKGLREVSLADQPCYGRRSRLVWVKRRWRCLDKECEVGSFTDQDARIAPVRGRPTARAGRWATGQVGEGRAVGGSVVLGG